MRGKFLAVLAGCMLLAFEGCCPTISLAQDCNGSASVRTPVRNAFHGLRSLASKARPANWRVFNQHSAASCSSSVAAASCGGVSNVPVSVAPASCSNSVVIPDSAPVPVPTATSSASVTSIVCDGKTCKPVTSTASSVTTQGVIGDRIAARRAIMAAASKALKADNISFSQYLLLAGATRHQPTLDRLMDTIHEAAIADGMATTQAINWDGLAAFLERIMPIILQIIQLIGKTAYLLGTDGQLAFIDFDFLSLAA